MVNRDDLASLGLRAYEGGRLRMALRALVVLGPLCALCLFEARGRASCGCAAIVLVVAALVMRWRSRRGVDSATTGILAGLVPLTGGLVFKCLDLDCEVVSCTIGALLVGGASGFIVGLRSRRGSGLTLGGVLSSACIAALATCLGCIRLGTVGLAAMIAGIAIGVAVTTLAHARAALPGP